MSGVGLVTNPRAQTNQRDPSQMRTLGYLLGSRGVPEATGSLSDLYRVAEQFRSAGIDILGINGGDGTISTTLTAFIDTYAKVHAPLPLVAILRGGTMNTVANALGIKGTPGTLLLRLLDKYHTGEEFRILEQSLLKIGDRYGFIFGNGVIERFLRAYYRTPQPTAATAARLLSCAAASAAVGGSLARELTRRFHARVTADGETWAVSEFIAISASVVEHIGLGFRPFPRARERAGSFALLGVHTDALGVALEAGRLRRGLPMRRDKVVDTLASEVTLESDEPIGYMFDGEMLEGSRSLRIEIGPKLRFVLG
jgi:diacylglycerol kinase (ATP)